MSKTLDVMSILEPDQLGMEISRMYVDWESLRLTRLDQWKELTRYIFAVDTTTTSNSKLPWSNKTTLPKLCQIRDNLHSNYMAALFPRNKWLEWIADDEDSNSLEKRTAIEAYMTWVIDRNQFYDTQSRLVYDFIDYGNVFVMPEWHDGTNITEEEEGRIQVGYVGPQLRRISPLDIVFNPTAPSFEETPKIIRSIISFGELKQMMEAQTADEDDKETAKKIYDYVKTTRRHISAYELGAISTKDDIFQISGFTSYQQYMMSDNVEVLTFYGDLYDKDSDTLKKNQVIKIVDRHKVIYDEPNETYFGTAPIYHCGWRLRPDNLWGMGPLDNLVGMQYRIDHLENMKADCFDLIAYPPLKVKGYVDDFKWGPMEKILVGDDADVEMLSPDVQVLQADNQIALLEAKMEEMAGSPKEAMGFRTPGEKTKYEVQSMENGASRMFQNKSQYYERHIVENSVNAMLEMARRNMSKMDVRLFDPEYNYNTFIQLTAADITGSGRIRPMAARHFAEQAQMVQNLTGFFNSGAGTDQAVNVHFSGFKLAKMWEHILELDKYKVVQPYIRLMEQADARKQANQAEQQIAVQAATPNGFTPGDYDVGTEPTEATEPGVVSGDSGQGPVPGALVQ